jgi:hypothetical protein
MIGQDAAKENSSVRFSCKSSDDASAIAKPKASVSQRKKRGTGFDEDIAVEDAELIEDDKDFDPRMILAGTELPFHLKERKS